MITESEDVVIGGAAAILAVVGIDPAGDELEFDADDADCELRLWISDGFTRQAWSEGGERWTETRDRVVFNEDEVARITITNDRAGTRVVSLGRRRRLLRLLPGETRSLTLRIDDLEGFDIAVVCEPMIMRPADVRPLEDAVWESVCRRA